MNGVSRNFIVKFLKTNKCLMSDIEENRNHSARKTIEHKKTAEIKWQKQHKKLISADVMRRLFKNISIQDCLIIVFKKFCNIKWNISIIKIKHDKREHYKSVVLKLFEKITQQSPSNFLNGSRSPNSLASGRFRGLSEKNA